MLGEAFLLTRRAYFSLGVHAGFVLGAKTWRVAVSGGIPQWLAGPGSVPLVGAPAVIGMNEQNTQWRFIGSMQKPEHVKSMVKSWRDKDK